ncbi:hypothetical protein NDU88_002259 [Pleurodeles waltl]|uniref:Uncharacterized protein n=1 Tax=Pleurodeles waltl TaxID=8319 RepID=A0AAV7TK14_PLEWA|nr:hypothetical protein NDU88_002259 [Pleurodeles waltl]
MPIKHIEAEGEQHGVGVAERLVSPAHRNQAHSRCLHRCMIVTRIAPARNQVPSRCRGRNEDRPRTFRGGERGGARSSPPIVGETRSVIERTISDVLTAAAGVTRLIRLLSHAAKTNMAPKAIRNLGDKSEGVKMTRIGRDKGETAGVNKRLTSITGKAAGKNTLGLMKDAKMSDSTIPPSEIK